MPGGRMKYINDQNMIDFLLSFISHTNLIVIKRKEIILISPNLKNKQKFNQNGLFIYLFDLQRVHEIVDRINWDMKKSD
jgi:hypothetical protein